MKTVNEYFDAQFAAAKHQLAFCKEWDNGTGYLDGAVYQQTPSVPAGEYFAFTTEGDRWGDRKGILFPTILGNVVVFERYANDPRVVLVSNRSQHLKPFFRNNSGALSVDDLEDIFGQFPSDSIASRVLQAVESIRALG